jgi:hypothetical protein
MAFHQSWSDRRFKTRFADCARGREIDNKLLCHTFMGVGKLDDIANAVSCLASNYSSFVTGIEPSVDGGGRLIPLFFLVPIHI